MVVTEPKIETIPVLNVPNVIHIGFDLLDHIAQDLTTSVDQVSNYVIITDNHLAPLYLPKLMPALQSRLSSKQHLLTRIIPAGETSKCRRTKAYIEDYLLSMGCTRDTCLIALGGGVIGDLVGYVASTFMRGIPFVHVPTTLLAMVDSSIGGKTAIDTTHGKNLIGTFWQPVRIYISLSMLQTLPKREFSNGMAEVIKTAAISSAEEFEKLENGKEKIESALRNLVGNSKAMTELDADREFLKSIIGASARFKAQVVTQDEREGGLRGLLNFGHSIGHAYEAILFPEWLHGECVSLGLLHETELSCALGHCSPDVIERLRKCLELYGLPVEMNSSTKEKLTVKTVMDRMRLDKKNKGSQKRIVLLSSVGDTWEKKASDVSDTDIVKIISKHIPAKIAIGQATIPQSNIRNNQPLPANMFLFASSPKLFKHVKAISEKMQSIYNIELTMKEQHIECISSERNRELPFHIYFTEAAGIARPVEQETRWFEFVTTPLPENDTFDESYENEFTAQTLQFVNSILHPKHARPLKGKQSCFTTLTVPNYENVIPNLLSQWTEKAEAVEFRVDLLAMQDSHRYTADAWVQTAGKQLAYLRRLTSLPIIYTVRTIPQAGKFDPTLTDVYLQLLEWGHRWGCEYVDLELTTLPHNQLESIMQINQTYFPNTKIIASFHDPKGDYAWTPTTSSMMYAMYCKAARLFETFGHAGVIKLVGTATSFWSNIDLEQFRKAVDDKGDAEVILINMGPLGKFSRVANAFLSPATHPALPSVAAPGQLSIDEMASLRRELNMDNY